VLLTDDETMRGLNRQFRKKNKPTDVLSFPAPELEDPPLKRSRTRHAGDVAISLTTAARQAEAFEHPLEVEVKILLLHGLLHLAGFDHETDGGEMARREAELRQKFGLPAGLIARSGDSVGDSKKQRRRVRS
jgi:probable rRNA maturation factor